MVDKAKINKANAEQTMLFDAAAKKASKQDKRQALTQAAYWHAQLSADDVSEQSTLDWQAWLTADNVISKENKESQVLLNQWAWQQVKQLQANFKQLPNELFHQSSNKTSSNTSLAVDALSNIEPHVNQERRMALRSLIVVFGTGSLGWLSYKNGIDDLIDLAMAEQRSKTGEVRTLLLPDGTSVILNTASAIDIKFSSTERRIILREGEIMVQTAKSTYANSPSNNLSNNPSNSQNKNLSNSINHTELRPFIVQTEYGDIQALGTKFSVREFPNNIAVNVYQHSVRVTTNSGKQQLCPTGKSLNFSRQHISVLQNKTNNEGWIKQILHVNNMPLTEFINEVGRYRVGVMRCDASLAKHHISGAFNTGDTEQILRAISNAFPIKIKRFSRYWLNIAPR